MTLTGVHILLSYACTNECDHCFVYSSPRAKGTFTLDRLHRALAQLPDVGTITRVYFEGGEPFLFYPLLVDGVGVVREMGLEVGIVTNAYWAQSPADAELWLRPLHHLGLSDLSLSDDWYHYGEEAVTPPQHAQAAAQELGMPVGVISIGRPTIETSGDDGQSKGEPIVGGGTRFKGRAADKLTEGLPLRPWSSFTECLLEDLASPRRIHVDAYGNVLLCQGISMGNLWETPLSRLIAAYDGRSHPICGPLIEGGPAQLTRHYEIRHDDGYVDACHLCYASRGALLDRFPEYLAPRQVYGP